MYALPWGLTNVCFAFVAKQNVSFALAAKNACFALVAKKAGLGLR